MLAFSEKLYSLLASPYAYIAVRTFEEERVVETIRALAGQLQRQVVEWAPDRSPEEGLVGMLESLREKPEGAIAVVKDSHPFLRDVRVVRKLREHESRLSGAGQAVVLVSPHIDVPPDLIKDVTFLDAPLPGRIELEVVLDEVFAPDQWPELQRERMVSAALGLTLREAHRAFCRVQFEQRQSARRGQRDFDFENAVVAEKRRLIEADRILVYCALDRNLADIGGLGSLKAWLKERQLAFTQAAAEFGLPSPRGLLLTGVQGCGKSLFAKAVAGFWGIPLLQLDISRLFDGAIPPEAALSRAIKTSEALSPAVLWIDEIDKAFGEDSGPVSRMMGSLLGWLQDKTHPVFFVATANRVERLPPELLRKGRFDEIFFVDLPTEDERRQILAIHIDRRGRRPEQYDLTSLAQRARYFSGAELEQVVVSALFKAFANNRDLQPVDLDAAVQEMVPLYRTYENEIKALREWAEGRARPAARDRRLIDLFNQSKPTGGGR